jgi:cation:H+ antiporter
MLITFLLLALGIALLIGGGSLLVHSASQLAARAGVSPLIVGLTVVAFGTSLPELMVNTMAAFSGASGLAFGNVVGSNIANLGLVLGLSALFVPLIMQGQLIIRELPLLLLGTAALLVMILDGPLREEPSVIDASDALILMLLFCAFLYITARELIRQDRDPLVTGAEHLPIVGDDAPSLKWNLAQVGTGILLLAVGGQMTIDNGVELADLLGLSTAVIGLIFIALGTSLPELVTSVIAAIRKEPDLAVGNVLGSNLFNSLFVLPVGALITPVAVPAGGTTDLVVSLLFTVALLPIFVFGNSYMGRIAGAFCLLAYVAYLTGRVLG